LPQALRETGKGERKQGGSQRDKVVGRKRIKGVWGTLNTRKQGRQVGEHGKSRNTETFIIGRPRMYQSFWGPRLRARPRPKPQPKSKGGDRTKKKGKKCGRGGEGKWGRKTTNERRKGCQNNLYLCIPAKKFSKRGC